MCLLESSPRITYWLIQQTRNFSLLPSQSQKTGVLRKYLQLWKVCSIFNSIHIYQSEVYDRSGIINKFCNSIAMTWKASMYLIMFLRKSLYPKQCNKISYKLPPPICLPIRAAAIFQLSWPSDRIGTIRYATVVPIVVATVITQTNKLTHRTAKLIDVKT